MSRRKTLTLGIVLVLTIGGATAWLVLARSPSSLEAELMAFVDSSIRDAKLMRVRLLCESGPQELLQAGRQVLSKVPPEAFNKYPLEPGQGEIMGFYPIPSKVPMPEAIRNLRPHHILAATRGYLIIEMHGGMDHFGLYVYPEDYKAPDPDFTYGDRQLIPGLWYYDEGYHYNSDYDKRIDALIETYKTGTGDARDEPAHQ